MSRILREMVGNPSPVSDAVLGRHVFSQMVEAVLDVRDSATQDDGRALLDNTIAKDLKEGSVPRLFSMGYVDRAAEFHGPRRRAFHAAMSSVVDEVEARFGQEVWPEILCRLQGAEAGWVLESMAASLARRGTPWPGVPSAIPWLLDRLEPSNPELSVASDPQAPLAEFMERLLERGEHRFTVVRRLALEAVDVRILRTLCASPKFFTESELCVRLLTQGDSRQISCALHALHLKPAMEPGVAGRFCEVMQGQPFNHVVERLTEIYAQISLRPERRTHLARAIRTLAVHAAMAGKAGENGNVLMGAVRGDARMFRHIFLACDVSLEIAYERPGHARTLWLALLERLALTLTPAGVAHPLNDGAFAEKIGVVLAARVGDDGYTLADIVAIADGVMEHARSFPGQVDSALAARFFARLCTVVLSAARIAWRQPGGHEASLQLYGAVAHLAAGPARCLVGTGILGALEHRVDPDEVDGITRGLLAEVAHLEAGAFAAAPLEPNVAPVGARPMSPETTAPQPYAVASTVPSDALQAWASTQQGPRTPWGAVVALLLGFDAVRRMLLVLAHGVGYRREGVLTRDEAGLVLTEETRWLNRRLGSVELKIPRASIGRISMSPCPSRVYRACGLAVLLPGVSGGMFWLFQGLKGQDLKMVLMGLCVGVVALVFDGACHRAWLESRDRVFLDVFRNDGLPDLGCRTDGRWVEGLQNELDSTLGH